MERSRGHSRRRLMTGAALACLALSAAPATADSGEASSTLPAASQGASASTQARAPIEERQSYVLRAMAQIYDGTRDLSHSQVIGIGRVRKGNRSVTQFDYGDGAVVIVPDEGRMSASRFLNVTGTERRVVYEYDTKRVRADGELAGFHNSVVRPFLGQGPELGSDARWSAAVPLEALTGDLGSDTEIAIELSRTYFTHDGKDMVLVEYAIPAFAYPGNGEDALIVQWGCGFALTDPGFGMIYLNAALHRAVETRPGMPARPYRFARNMVAANPDGSAMVDYREIPQLAGVIEPVLGAEAMMVVPVDDAGAPANGVPLALGRRLDMLALAIGEDGANEVPLGAAAQTGGARGVEVSPQLAQEVREALARELGTVPANVPAEAVNAALEQLGARAMTGGSQMAFPGGSSGFPMTAEESAQAIAEGSSGRTTTPLDPALEKAVLDAVDDFMQQRGWEDSDPFGTTQETLDALQQSRAEGDPAGDAFARVSDGGGANMLFGGQGDEKEKTTFQKAEDAANKVNQGNQVASGTKVLTGVKTTGDAVVGGRDLPKQTVSAPVSAQTAQLEGMLSELTQQSSALENQIKTHNARLAAVESELANVPLKPQPGPAAVKALARFDNETKMMGSLDNKLNSLASEINRLKAAGSDLPPSLLSQFDEVLEARDFQAQKLAESFQAYSDAMNAPGGFSMVPDMDSAKATQLLGEMEDLRKESSLLQSSMEALGARSQQVLDLMRSTPVAKLNDLLNTLGNSRVGQALDALGHALNFWTIGKSGANIYTASTTNIGAGDLPLTRDYSGSGSAMFGMGAEFLGLLGNAATLNLPGFVSDTTAITLGSISDIVIAYKGVVDVEKLELEAQKEAVRLAKMKTDRVIKAEQEAFTKLLNTEYGLYTKEQKTDGSVSSSNWKDARIDPETGLPTPGYWAYLKENYPGTLASYGIDPDAPVGHVGPWPPEPETKTKPTGKTAQQIQDEFQDATKDDYPTAPKVTPKQVKVKKPAPQETILTEQQLKEIEREKRRAEAQEELDRYQAEKLARMKEEEKNNPARNGGSDVSLSTLEVSELVVSKFDIEPVRFERVVFKMPVFDEDGDLFVRNEDGTTSLRKVGPDDFEITPFDAPEISRFPPTDPDDIDGYPGTGQYPAFSFDGLSGTVNVDLSKWEDWLATQDVHKLIQLAIAAGYPYAPGSDGMATLAIALADAENLIRMSQDSGYRAWANQAPSCGGYVGCGPSYLERWTQKRSIVALGDILADSRGIFSTGGFSDIGISGFNLMYVLRDFGIQDGDLIDVEISQFGRTIQRLQGHFLLNAGSPFNVGMRPGVAQMVVTALNEGSASPNTAEVTISNVVRGDAVQTYSLETGQTAVLRIEANASPSPTGSAPAQGAAAAASAAASQPRPAPPPPAPSPGAPRAMIAPGIPGVPFQTR